MKKDKGLISFSLDGFVTLDIPMKPHLKVVMNKLNKIIVSNNGKIYLAKDNFLDNKILEKCMKIVNYFQILGKQTL